MMSGRAWFLLLLGSLALLAFLWTLGLILYPFLPALLAAATAAVTLHPLLRRLMEARPGHRTLAAAALTLLVLVLFVGPFLFAGWALAREMRHAVPLLRDWAAADVRGRPFEVSGALQERLQAWNLDVKSLVADNLDQIGAWAGRALRSTVRSGIAFVAQMVVFGAFLFFFLRDGPGLVQRAIDLAPLSPNHCLRIVERIEAVLVAIVRGVFLVAAVQGILALVGFTLIRVPFPVLLAALCMVFSPIPVVGGAVVWVPVAAWTALGGEPSKALALLLWFGLVYSFADNMVRPIFIGARAKLPLPLALIGILGGLMSFGFAGLFIGPVAIAVAAVAVDLLEEQDDGRQGKA